MKRLAVLFCFLSFVLSAQNSAEKDSSGIKKFIVGGYYLNTGFSFWDPRYLSENELEKVWPGFNMSDYPGYKQDGSFYSGKNFAGPVFVAVGLTFYNNARQKTFEKKRFQTNADLFYSSAQEASASLRKITSERFDTLYSTSGPIYFRDSVHVNTINFNYYSDYLGLNLSETFNLKFNRILSVYGGSGINFRYSLSPKVTEVDGSHSYLSMTSNPQKNYDSTYVGSSYGRGVKTVKHVSASYSASVYLLFGANLQIVKFKKSRLLLNSAMRFGSDFTKFKRLPNTEGRGYAMFTFGLRYVYR